MLNVRVRARAACIFVLAVATAMLAGCGGGGKAKQATLPTTSTTPTPSTAAQVSQIRQNWAAFFDGSTSSAERIRLLEDGQKFASVIDALGSSSLAKQVKARVGQVKLTSSTTASVTYTILLSDNPVLKNVRGQAVLVNGSWKVGAASVCGLAKLEGATPPACAGK